MCQNANHLTQTLWQEWNKDRHNKYLINQVVENSQFCAANGCQHCRYELNRLDKIFINESQNFLPVNFGYVSCAYFLMSVVYSLGLWLIPEFMKENSIGYSGLVSLVLMCFGSLFINEWSKSFASRNDRVDYD